MKKIFYSIAFKIFPYLRSRIKEISIDEVRNLSIQKVTDAELFFLQKTKDVYGKFNDDFNQDAYRSVIPEFYVYSLPRGIVNTGREEIFTKEKKVIKEITAQNVNPMIGEFFPLNSEKRIHGSVAYFSLSSLENCYGHYWCEYIGQIYLLWKSKIIPDFYVFTQELPFQKQFIPVLCKIFNIPQEKVLTLPNDTIIKPDVLIFTSLLNSKKAITCGNRTDWNKIYMPSFMKDVYRMLSNFAPENKSFGEKLYISRENSSLRRTQNEKEVQDLVSSYGFKTIYPEKFSIPEIISIFKTAKYVIATNGSGIAPFFITKKKGAKLLVLYPEFFPDTHFKILSSICDIEFNYLRCKSLTSLKKRPREDDLAVDLNGLKLFLEKLD